MKKKAVIWGYRFPDMKTGWSRQMTWIAKGLEALGYEVVKSKIKCTGLEPYREYEKEKDDPCDVVIYNHADITHIRGNPIKAMKMLFFKMTIPDMVHSTLDELGYGPFSSITYKKPDYESVEDWELFYDTVIKEWVKGNLNKYGKEFKKCPVELPDDYWLILGQVPEDEVVKRHDFGDYKRKLLQVTTEAVAWSDVPVVVKLHPWFDGTANERRHRSEPKKKRNSDKIIPQLKKAGAIVVTGRVDVHSMLPKSRGVIVGNSGSGIEAMMHHKPVISWGFPEYHWVTYNLRHLADLVNAMTCTEWFDKEAQAKWVKWYFRHYCIYNEASTLLRLKEVLDA